MTAGERVHAYRRALHDTRRERVQPARGQHGGFLNRPRRPGLKHAERRESAEARAQRLLGEELKRRGWRKEDLERRRMA